MPATTDYQLAGVSGSHPAGAPTLREIIDRKRTRNDFDVLLVHDLSQTDPRRRRAWRQDRVRPRRRWDQAGLRNQPSARRRSFGDHQGGRELRAVSSTPRASRSAQCAGRCRRYSTVARPIAFVPPYAVDRLFVSRDGKPLHIVRNLPNGTQQKLDPKTHAVLQTIRSRSRAKSRFAAASKAANDHSHSRRDEYVEIVRRMFRRALIDGWGDWRIAKELIDERIVSPGGKAKWSRQSVKMDPAQSSLCRADRQPILGSTLP